MIHWEAHTCLPLHPAASFEPLERYRALGVHYASINVGMDMNPLSQILPVIAAFRARLAAEPERFVLPQSVADIEHAQANSGWPWASTSKARCPCWSSPTWWRSFAIWACARSTSPTTATTPWPGGCHDAPQGLTALGRRMVEAVNDAGVLMDCAHTERRSSLDIMAHSRHPVVFSHANPLALAEHGRNISDEQIRACAATGGVVCISGVSPFLGVDHPDAADVARHVAYVADLVGAEHVGLGLDIGFSQRGLNDDPPPPFDPAHGGPQRRATARASGASPIPRSKPGPDLPQALRAVGMSDTDIDGVMGGNMARVARHVWGG